MKRVRTEDLFSTQPARGHSGSYLRLALTSGTAFRSKGWPWVQMCMRGILGGKERVEKANMLADGSMIVKTQNHKQTEKLMKAKKFGDEDCEVVSDPKLNSSRGTITAYDLLELTESEVVSAGSAILVLLEPDGSPGERMGKLRTLQPFYSHLTPHPAPQNLNWTTSPTMSTNTFRTH